MVTWVWFDGPDQATVAGTEVGGDVWGTWLAIDSPFYLTDNITIPKDKILNIEAGVTVVANGSYRILVEGTILAIGTFSSWISFQGNDSIPSKYRWQGFEFNSTASGKFEYCYVNNAWYGGKFNGTKDFIANHSSFNNGNIGIYCDNNSVNNTFYNCDVAYNNLGVILNNSHNNYFISCDITENFYEGFILNESSFNNIYSSAIDWNGYGMFLLGNSSNNSINSSAISYNSYSPDSIGLVFSKWAKYNLFHATIFNSNIIELSWNLNSNTVFRYCTIEDPFYLDNSSIVDFLYCDIFDNFEITDANNITIHGCYLKWGGQLFLNRVNDIEISNAISNSETTAIQIRGNSKNIKVIDCNFSVLYGRRIRAQNQPISPRDIRLTTPVTGIVLDSVSNVEIINVTIIGFDYGMLMFYCNDTRIISSKFYYNYYSGIQVYSSDIIHIEDSQLNDNIGNGIYFYTNSNDIHINSTTISDNRGSGCVVYGPCSQVILENLVVENNNYNGIELYPWLDETIIRNCRINDNSDLGIHTEIDKLQIYDSELSYNSVAGIGSRNGIVRVENSTIMYNSYTLDLGYDYGDYDTTVYLINTSYYSSIYIRDPYSRAYVGWFLDIKVQTPTFNPVPGAEVSLKSNYNPGSNDTSTEYNYQTNSNGKVPRILCWEYLVKQSEEINYNPYRLTASKPGLGANAKNIFISGSSNITITLEKNDLRVSELLTNWPNNQIPVDDKFNVTAVIENLGDNSFNNIWLYYHLTGPETNLSYYKKFDIIPAKTEFSNDWELTNTPPILGKYSVTARIDFADEVYELNEENNELSFDLFIVKRPTAVLEVNRSTAFVNQDITFSAENSVSQKAILEYIFDFGDGVILKERINNIVEHSYQKSGYYTVTLEIVDIDGISSEKAKKIVHIKNYPKPESYPMAMFIITPDKGTVRTTFSFDSSLSTPSEGEFLVNYTWSFGDNTTSGWEDPTHEYNDDGVYTISLMVRDSAGKYSKEYTQILTVINLGPQINLTVNKYQVFTGEQVILNANNTIDPDDTLFEPLTRFIWQFGDNVNYSESPIQYPDGKFDKLTKYVYTRPGEYIISLIVYDDDGASNQTTVTISVLDRDGDKPSDDSNVGLFADNYTLLIGLILLLCLIIPILFLLLVRRRRSKARHGAGDGAYGNEDYLRGLYDQAGGGEDGGRMADRYALGAESRSGIGAGTEPAGTVAGAGVGSGKKKASEKDKAKSKVKSKPRKSRTGSVRPVEVQVELPEEKVVDWKDEESAFNHTLTLGDVEQVSDLDLTSASIIGTDDEPEDEFLTGLPGAGSIEDTYEPLGLGQDQPLEPQETYEAEILPEDESEPDTDVVFELVEDEEELEEFEDEYEEIFEEELEELPEETEAIPRTSSVSEGYEDDEIVFEVEDESEVSKSPRKDDSEKKKKRLIPIPGVGFVTKSELQKAIASETGEMPVDPTMRCKWCNKHISGKFIKLPRKNDAGEKIGTIGPFCSAECAEKFKNN
jgi:PKD repeat protein